MIGLYPLCRERQRIAQIRREAIKGRLALCGVNLPTRRMEVEAVKTLGQKIARHPEGRARSCGQTQVWKGRMMRANSLISVFGTRQPPFVASFAKEDSSFPMSLRFLLCQDHKEQDIMRVHFKAMESYGEGNSTSQAMVADKVELIQMLFDGLIDSLVTAKGHIQRGSIEDKNKSLVRAGRIVLGLQGSLDLEKGGDLARNLYE